VSERLRLLLVLALAAAVRAPFWAEALRTPLDGDAAILGLMARHPFAGVTLWGQPYGSPLEAWLAAPFVWALGTTTAAVRIPAFLLGLGLVPVAWWLGRSLDPRAGLPAALLAACPSSYVLLLAAMPPPLYPSALLLAGALLALAAGLGESLEQGRPAWGGLVLWGALAGLALWTHLMTGSVVLAGAAWLLMRARGRRARLIPALAALAAAGAPWWWRVLGDAGASRALGLHFTPSALFGHAAAVVPRLHETLFGLGGGWAPWVADVAAPRAATPWPAAAPLVLLQCGLLVAAVALRGARARAMLLAAIVLTVAAFPLSRRAGPGDVRFLAPLYLPALALIAWALVRLLPVRRTYAAVALIGALNLTGGARLLADWRGADRAADPFHLPLLSSVRRLLEEHGIRRAYASYGPAWRLSYESGERLIVSQFRNERFPDHPLPYLDEVRFAGRVAWILTPGIPSDMPAPAAFENDLRVAGGSWKRDTAGSAVVFHGFLPPFGPGVVPLASAGRAGDGEPTTSVSEPGRGAVRFDVTPPQLLDALTLLAPAVGAPLPASVDVEASADGESFETVARRRRQRDRLDLVWEGRQPRYVLDSSLLAVPLGGRRVAALRLVPVGEAAPWGLAEVLLHPSTAERRPAWERDEAAAPDGNWAARRALLAARRSPDHVGWHIRSRIAAGHP
jgi:hypothetical protein